MQAANRDRLFNTLGEIALGALKEGYIQISQTVIKDYVRTQLEEERLKHAGLLLFQYVGEDPDKKSGFYKFPHLTFQEYFAGRTLASQLFSKDAKEQERAVKFLFEHQYEGQYARPLSFMAGAVSKSKGVEGIQLLLRHLKTKKSIVGLQHLLLQLRAIQEWLCMATESAVARGMATPEEELKVQDSLKEWFGKGLEQVRREGYGTASPGGRLLGLLSDSLQSFRSVSRHAPELFALLQKSAKYEDKDVFGGYPVRMAVVETLGATMSVFPEQSGAILDILRKKAAKDRASDVRKSAVEVLGGAMSVFPEQSGVILDVLHKKAAEDEYSAVRSAAAKFLAQARGSTAAEAVTRTAPLGDLQRFTGLIKAEASQIEETLRSYKLSKSVWERYFGPVGEEPPLPAGIEAIMNSTCPFWPPSKVKETHLLVLIPARVAGKPLTLDYLGELIKRPQGGGYGTQYDYYPDYVREAVGCKCSGRSYWVLMTRGVLPESRAKSYLRQWASVKRRYTVPRALESAVVMLLHHVRSGERLYGDNPWTWTRCRESAEVFQLSLTLFVEGFSSGASASSPSMTTSTTAALLASGKF